LAYNSLDILDDTYYERGLASISDKTHSKEKSRVNFYILPTLSF
jgi:hypothetical protein